MNYFNTTSIEHLKETFELFTNDFSNILRDIDLIEEEKIALTRERTQLNEIKQDIERDKAALKTRDEAITIEKEALDTEKREMVYLSQKLEVKRQDALLTIQQGEDAKLLLARAEDARLKNEAEAKELEEKEKDIIYREEQMRREIVIDKERKMMLNAQEQKLQSEQERISRILPS